MEMIRLRAAQGQVESATHLLLDLVKDMAAEQGLMYVKLYYRAGLCTDLAVNLLWSTDLPYQGSRAGLSISELLKPFGLVEHSMWLEKEKRAVETKRRDQPFPGRGFPAR
ncbi:MAG: hypothetical protein ABSC19_07920 [Syntrophorhabdales bacterium]